MKLLLATRSEGKFRELEQLFADTPIQLLSLRDLRVSTSAAEEGLETSTRLVDNALAKARYFHGLTGLPTLADDSGLAVDALDGEPGVRSKRYAPPELQAELGESEANMLCLLRALEAVADAERTAHFDCAMALVLDDEEQVFDGRVDGVILREPQGDGGFGYDPLFLLPERGMTMAELLPAEKNEISHRGQAARKARAWLLPRLGAETPAPEDQ